MDGENFYSAVPGDFQFEEIVSLARAAALSFDV